jgi:oxygen-dependent protoporphyrinogen oxidase
MTAGPIRHVVVVGGGIAGLAAAWFLHRDGGPGLRVTVLESSDAVGGKLRVSDLAGVPVDEGAEALLLRRPEAVELADQVGLGPDRVEAVTADAAVWSRGRMRRLPPGTLMGVPTDLRGLARSGLLSPVELGRVPLDAWLPGRPPQADVAVGRLVADRLGRAVVDRLVEPLLGGVYAGRADELSLAATVPALLPHVRATRSLLAAAAAARSAAPPSGGPVFGSVRGGLGRLPPAVAAASGATVRTRATVRSLRRTPQGWALTVGPASAPEQVLADGVLLAVPAPALARLLRGVVPVAGAEAATIGYSSMAVVTLAYARTPGSPRAVGSGFLVPPVDGRTVKAVTFSSAKWGWYADAAPDLDLVRLSVGRLGEEAVLQRDDTDLVDLAAADLADATGRTASPVDARVTRWGGGLPQYTVGHLDRVRRLRAAVAAQPALGVCGAALDGVGVPACVGSAASAAAQVLGQWSHGTAG